MRSRKVNTNTLAEIATKTPPLRNSNYDHDHLSSFRTFILWWSRRDFRSNFLFSIVTALILQLAIFKIWDQSFSQIDGGGIQDHTPDGSLSSLDGIGNYEGKSSFAVVINTYRRPQMLNDAVQHYAETCGKKYRVGQVFVVWADQKLEAPEPRSFFTNIDNLRGNINKITLVQQQKEKLSNRADVEVLKKAKDSLNSRFEPIKQLQTNSVFMVDDDVRVTCSSLLMAFQAWEKYPNSMVGYYPRLASSPSSIQRIISTIIGSDIVGESSSRFVYNAWPVVYWRHKFNIILTKASFIHSKYLELYTNDHYFPKEIKDYVDRHKNCEDIAMSMLVANYTKHYDSSFSKITTASKTNTISMIATAPPIYVEGQISDLGLFGGISSGTGHWATRSDCLTQLSEIFRSKGWESPLEDQFDLTNRSWVRHAPGFWWQSKPSNIFEWFGLGNVMF